ncbi:MAG: polyketide synthase [Verrucomicrobiales bacterium]|nr:polyketide synthase [Verrucomicrobiales bacterium]
MANTNDRIACPDVGALLQSNTPIHQVLAHAARVAQFLTVEGSVKLDQPQKPLEASDFGSKDFRIRNATEADIPELLKLEEECWLKPLRAGEDSIKSRQTRFPEGQWVLEHDDIIAGSLYTQIIPDEALLEGQNFLTVERAHSPGGGCLQLLTVNVFPRFQNRGYGDQLLEFVLQWASVNRSIRQVIAVSRCQNFSRHAGKSMDDYIRERNGLGDLLDSTLHFHEIHGASIERVMPKYRPGDEANGDSGVLVSYDLKTRVAKCKKGKTKKPFNPKQNILSGVEQAVKSVLGTDGSPAYDHGRALLEMGLGSVDLLQLKSELAAFLGVEVEVSSFYQYPTPELIAKHIALLAEEGQIKNSKQHGTAKKSTGETMPENAVAIVGMACRFPGAPNIESYWQLLLNGVDAVSEVPASRWNIDDYYHSERKEPGKICSRHGGFLENVDRFDAQFFHVAPREAVTLDPQQRLLLETSWEALEDAAINPETLRGSSTGVFTGIFSHDYETLQTRLNPGKAFDSYYATGTSCAVASGRVSYFFGFTGPALSINTACSSSLVAVHSASQSLLLGECNLALASGVNAILSPDLSITFSHAGMLSADGKCKTFDAGANGYSRAEGCGVVVLKRLKDAVEAGDRILAVIRGSRINQDGASNGLTAPNGASQQAVIEAALASAGVEANEITYVEAHGTGTVLGDLVEGKALQAAYMEDREPGNGLTIGSVKTNIGHAEAAAGMAGLIKVVLAMRHGIIPRNLHYHAPNPELGFEKAGVTVPTKSIPWNSLRRLAGINGFGFSGTNAHIILQEWPEEKETGIRENGPFILTISARTEPALRELAARYAAHFEKYPAVNLTNFCYTCNFGRARFEHGMTVKFNSVPQAIAELSRISKTSGSHATYDRETEFIERRGKVISIPHYPFQRERFWVEPTLLAESSNTLPTTLHPFITERISSPIADLLFAGVVNVQKGTFLLDHCVEMIPVFPATGYIEILLEALSEEGKSSWALEDVTIAHALSLAGGGSKTVQVVGHKQNEKIHIHIYVKDDREWVEHLTAIATRQGNSNPLHASSLPEIRGRCRVSAKIENFQQGCVNRGIQYGPAFRGLKELWMGASEALGRVKCEASDFGRFQFHPELLDGCLQVALSLFPDPATTFLPFGIQRCEFYSAPNAELWCNAVLMPIRHAEPEIVVADLDLFSLEGKLVAKITGLSFKRVRKDRAVNSATGECCYEIQWVKQALRSGQAEWIPSSELIQQTIQSFLNSSSRRSDIQLLDSMESCCVDYIQAAFSKWWNPNPGQTQSRAEIVKALGIVPAHSRLLDRLLEILEESGFIRGQKEKWMVLRKWDQTGHGSLEKLLADYPESRAELTLLQRCGSNLGQVLRGEIEAPQLLFPDGDFTTAATLYQDSPAFAEMNRLAVAVMGRIGASLPRNRKIRIVEIGGGTGGTTSLLLPLFDPETTEYLFTDLSPAFTNRAERQYGAFPFVRYARLDIEQDPAGQGIESGSFDIVIAANVLHATRQLGQTMHHVQSLLAPGGMILLLEGVSSRRWIDLIFGLTDGWWRFDDRELRGKHPLLSKSQWEQFLAAKGFEQINAGGINETGLFPQGLITARKPLGKKHSAGPIFLLSMAEDLLLSIDDRIKATGGKVVRLVAASDYRYGSTIRLDLKNPEHFARLFKDIGADTGSEIVFHWPGNRKVQHEATGAEALASSSVLLHLVQAATAHRQFEGIRISIVTEGAVAVNGEMDYPGAAGLWGMAKAIELEERELIIRRFDLDQYSPNGWNEILDEIETVHSGERQIGFRNGDRRVARLQARPAKKIDAFSGARTPFKLYPSPDGILQGLKLVEMSRVEPGFDEVEIEVAAVGLNFLDVLDALRVLPFKRSKGLGVECAGKIIRVGSGVTGLSAGDEVFGLAHGCFAQYSIAHADNVVKKPASFSYIQAASLPVNFLTARHALVEVARMQPGERVLIHAAAGGTGLAAVALAQKAGAEIYATASPAKWTLLQSLGIKNIFNSRNLEFHQEILSLTNGEGVDVVLNSLTGEFIRKGISLLREGGRFLEIGKTDILSQQEARDFNPKASYHLVDIYRMSLEQPTKIQKMLVELRDEFSSGRLKFLSTQVFDVSNCVEAFRTMQQGKHIGKIVLTFPDSNKTLENTLVRRDGTYVISGGTGGLGLLMTQWLVDRKAGGVLLLGRSEPSQDAWRRMNEWNKGETRVIWKQADVSDYLELETVLKEGRTQLPPVRGVLHAAGTLSDGSIRHQTHEKYQQVLGPKVNGALNLQELTWTNDLDFFVLFSSTASLLGWAGQSNHSAANAFLDSLAYWRRSQGKPGLSINWGAWAEVGAATRGSIREQMESKGMRMLAPEAGLKAFENLLLDGSTQAGVAEINWQRLLGTRERNAFLSHFEPKTKATETPMVSSARSELSKLQGGELLSFLRQHIRREVAGVLGIKTPESIDTRHGFFTLGMDSLTSVELRNCLQKSLEITLGSTIAFDYPNIEALADYIAMMVVTKPGDESEEKAEIPVLPHGLDDLSEEDLSQMLADKLATMNG